MRKPSPSMIVALVALFVSLSGVAVAANGGNFILGHSNAASKATVLSAAVAGGKALQVANNDKSNAASTALALHVASGHAPFTVNSGVKVAHLNADRLDGIDSSALQRRVTGSCSGNSAIAQITAAGGVGCTNVKFYSGRLVVAEPLIGNPTFLTIPGIAHLRAYNCSYSLNEAEAEMINDSGGTFDIWGGENSYAETTWTIWLSPLGLPSQAVLYLGKGSGPRSAKAGSGSTTVTVTVSTMATGSQCIYQATAEVITS